MDVCMYEKSIHEKRELFLHKNVNYSASLMTFRNTIQKFETSIFFLWEFGTVLFIAEKLSVWKTDFIFVVSLAF